jgi:hypothetical protein
VSGAVLSLALSKQLCFRDERVAQARVGLLVAVHSLPVSDLGHRIVPGCTSKLAVQFLNFSDLLSETPELVAKNSQIIHVIIPFELS